LTDRSGVDRLRRRPVCVGLHRDISVDIAASASLPAGDSLDLWPTIEPSNRA